MNITAGLTATKAGLDVARLLMDKLNEPDVDVHDVRSKVQQMLIHVVNAQVALGEAQVEISELQRQLEIRDELKALQADVEFVIDGGFFVRRSESSRGLIAYCPVCWTKDEKLVPLQTRPDANGWFRCSVHNTIYLTHKRYQDEERKSRQSGEHTSGGPHSWMR